jgi:hypothetical protein
MTKRSSTNLRVEIKLVSVMNAVDTLDCSRLSIDEVLQKRPLFVPEDFSGEDLRWELVKEAEECRFWGVDGKRVIALGWRGRVLFDVQFNDEVLGTYIPHRIGPPGALGEWTDRCISFWMIKEELGPLGKWLRQKMANQVPFETLFNGKL